MAKKSIAKNYIYNLIYQLLTVLLPLVTTPYLSRILGAKSIGIYGYTVSIVTYFILFGTLGMSLYGQREIAYRQTNIIEKSKTFFEIIILRTITLFISISTFYFVFCINNEYSLYYSILLVQLIATGFDISWFFQGMEEFDKTVIRNIIVKILSLILIFVVIKKPEDLWLYFVIYVLSELFGNISLWLYLPKYLKKVNIKLLNIKKHIKPVISLFLPQIAIQIYTVLDKTMLGVLTNNMNEVGFYEQAQKIVKALLLVVGSLQAVMSSRIANSYAKKDQNEINNCMDLSFKFVWFLIVPLCFGIITLAPKFVPWFYGSGFEKVIPLLITSSFLLIAIGLNGVTGVQYLVQIGKQNFFTISVIVGAVVNFIMNIVLIRYFSSVGATISSVIAEFSILILHIIYIKKHTSYRISNMFKPCIKCLISGLIMFGVLIPIVNYLPIGIIYTFIEIIIGCMVYLISMKILKYDLLNFNIIKTIFKKNKI